MNPLIEFERWYKKAVKAGDRIPDAMALATASRSGRPSVRFVLFKGIHKGAIHFFTNYKSSKAKELATNPFAEISVFWPQIYRQVRISGRVKRLTAKESDAYWKTRPRLSQIGAWASPQSQTIKQYSDLTERVKFFENKFKGMTIPRPPHWGGLAIQAKRVEFWTGENFRLHRREAFINKNNRWVKKLLAP